MTDVVKEKLNKYYHLENSKCKALAAWIQLKMKNFKLIDALHCVYISAGGDFSEMTKIISQLTEKKKVQGRTQVYNGENVNQIDIVRDTNGKLVLKGYNPDKKPIAKGQHLPRNQKIFRKSDDQVSKTFQNSERKMMDFGRQVKELYPGESNMYITHAMQAIKNYANSKKISTDKVVSALQKGRLKLKDEEYNSFEVVSESKIIVISEDIVRQLNEELEMTEYKFYNNVKKFLSDLLADPVNAKPSFLLQKNGLTRSRLLKLMDNVGIIERDDKISDTDENGEPKTATMLTKFRRPKVPKKNFQRNLRKLWIRLFERNLPERKHKIEVNEEGEGALSADASGEFSQPVFGIQRRQMPVEVEEATTTTTAGNYEYDVPFGGDKDTLARHNGIGGSVSVNKV